MDPNVAQLWTAGRIISPSGRPGSLTDFASSSQPVGRASFTTYPAYAEVLIANERTALPSGDRCHWTHRAKDYLRYLGWRTRTASVGYPARTRLQEECRRDWQGINGNLAGRASLRIESVCDVV